jgi:hypothetical protein
VQKGRKESHLHALIHTPRRQHIDSPLTNPLPTFALPVLPTTTLNDRSPPAHARHKVTVSLDDFGTAARDEVPDADGLVVRGGEEDLAGGVEEEGADPVVVAGLSRGGE